MLGSHKCLERLIHHFRLSYDLSLAPVSLVCYDGIGKDMFSQILTVLIRVSTSCLGCMEKSQTERIASGLIPTVFAVVHHGHPIAAVLCSQVGPLLRVYFIGDVSIAASFDCADPKVIHSLFI